MEKKKSLGQHFLHNAHYIQLVADAAAVTQGDTVLEIGPGNGALTKELLSRGAQVTAIEKDSRLIPVLEETFSDAIHRGTLRIIEDDALSVDLHTLGFVSGSFKIVANIPYYITGALLEKFLSGAVQPSLLVFLVQKEVAERIAKATKESILSLSVKVYGTPKYMHTVPAGAFTPPPDVDSAVLLVSHISRAHFNSPEHERMFFTVMKQGFSQKRKMLKNNIAPTLGEKTLSAMERAGIGESARAEDVPLEKWLLLTETTI